MAIIKGLRFVGVVEAVGSSPVTQTRQKRARKRRVYGLFTYSRAYLQGRVKLKFAGIYPPLSFLCRKPPTKVGGFFVYSNSENVLMMPDVQKQDYYAVFIFP